MKKIIDLQNKLSQIGPILTGSVMELYNRCGKKACACHFDDSARHGPYLVWTRKIYGKTVTKILSKDKADKCKEFIANTRQMEKLIEDIREESLKKL